MHKTLPGGYDVALREGKRTAIHGERPFFDPERSESLTERQNRLGTSTPEPEKSISPYEIRLNN